jgi:hypothetical protein
MAIRILAISLVLAALAGCASAPSTRGGNTAAQAQPMPVAADARYCAPPAASRIPPDPRHCPAGAGNVRTFTGEELERTGP